MAKLRDLIDKAMTSDVSGGHARGVRSAVGSILQKSRERSGEAQKRVHWAYLLFPAFGVAALVVIFLLRGEPGAQPRLEAALATTRFPVELAEDFDLYADLRVIENLEALKRM